ITPPSASVGASNDTHWLTESGGKAPLVSWALWRASPICFKLFALWARMAASRTFCTAGNSRPISTAMIAMTTRSSMRVNARGLRLRFRNIPTSVDRESGWFRQSLLAKPGGTEPGRLGYSGAMLSLAELSLSQYGWRATALDYICVNYRYAIGF